MTSFAFELYRAIKHATRIFSGNVRDAVVLHKTNRRQAPPGVSATDSAAAARRQRERRQGRRQRTRGRMPEPRRRLQGRRGADPGARMQRTPICCRTNVALQPRKRRPHKQTPICRRISVIPQPRKIRPANKRRFAAVLEGCPEYTAVELRVSPVHSLAPIGLLRETRENCSKSAFVSKPRAR